MAPLELLDCFQSKTKTKTSFERFCQFLDLFLIIKKNMISKSVVISLTFQKIFLRLIVPVHAEDEALSQNCFLYLIDSTRKGYSSRIKIQ